MQILEKLNLVHAPVRVISGTVSEGEEYLDNGRDAEVFRPGAVRYVDSVHLRPLLRLRNQVHKVLRQNSAPFLSVRAVSDEMIDSVQSKLVDLEHQIDAARDEFIQNFDNYVDAWVSKHPEVAKYRSKFPQSAWIRSRTGMDVSVFKIQPQQVKTQRDGIEREINGLAGRILREVAQDIEESWDPGASKGTEKIRGVIRRAIDKLDGLAFVDRDLAHVATMARQVLQRMPSTGVINGIDYVILSGLLRTLSEPSMVVSVAKEVAAGRELTDLWKPIVEILPEQAAAAQAAQADEQGDAIASEQVAEAAESVEAVEPQVVSEAESAADVSVPVLTERQADQAAAYNW